jgi:hypothetical protein
MVFGSIRPSSRPQRKLSRIVGGVVYCNIQKLEFSNGCVGLFGRM